MEELIMAYIKSKNIEDFTLFRNRISYRMRDLGIHSTKELSYKLFDTGFFKRTDSSGNIKSIKASSIEKTIQKHLQYDIPNKLPDSLTANHVQAYAIALQCSTDFILGNTHTISNDICIQDLCDRTGLTEVAVSNLLKMTDKRFAFKTLRIEATESRKLLCSILTNPELNSFLRSLNNISCKFNNETHHSLESLEKQIGSDRIKRALEWDSILDPLYEGPEPSELELQDIFLLREAMDEDYLSDQHNTKAKEFAKYQVIKNFQCLIENLYPDD